MKPSRVILGSFGWRRSNYRFLGQQAKNIARGNCRVSTRVSRLGKQTAAKTDRHNHRAFTIHFIFEPECGALIVPRYKVKHRLPE